MIFYQRMESIFTETIKFGSWKNLAGRPKTGDGSGGNLGGKEFGKLGGTEVRKLGSGWLYCRIGELSN